MCTQALLGIKGVLVAMAHYCHICDRQQANERFSGRGRKEHVCKKCMKLPRATRQRIKDVDEIHGFLRQSHISARNLERLRILAESSEEEVARLARLVHEMAEVKPYKTRRLKFLAKGHRDLIARLDEAGLLDSMRSY